MSKPVAGLHRALASLLDRKDDARQVVEIVLLELISSNNVASEDQASTTDSDGRTVSSSAAGTATPPSGKRPNKALDELLFGEDGEQPFTGSDDETDNDVRLASDDTDVYLPVYVPAETAYKLNFIDGHTRRNSPIRQRASLSTACVERWRRLAATRNQASTRLWRRR